MSQEYPIGGMWEPNEIEDEKDLVDKLEAEEDN